MDCKMKTWLCTTALPLLVIAAACGGDDPTGPGSGDPFDPARASQEFGAIEDAIDANADLEADLVHVSAALATMSTASWLLEPSDLSAGSPLVRSVRSAPLALSSSGQPLIPADLLGTTFEWDEAEGAYAATDRDGAPAAGIRFILYDRTQVPLVENGFLDITDESVPAADRLNVHVEKNGITRLDYDVEITQTASALTLGIAGFLTDGTSRIDLDVLEVLEETAGGFRIDVSYALSLAGQPLAIELDYVLDFGTTISLEIAARFVNGVNTLVLDLSQDDQGAIAGTVEWNGELVMTIADDGTGTPIFLGPDGEELTAAEAEAIGEMFAIALEGLDSLMSYLVFLGGGVA